MESTRFLDFNGNNAKMIFSVGEYAANNANKDAMTINYSGFVGIGTTTPSVALEVIGSGGLKVSGNSSSRGKIVLNTSYKDACDLVFSSNNHNYGQWWFSGRDSDESNRFTIYRHNSDFHEVMTFKYSNGHIGLSDETNPHYHLTLSETPSSVNMPSGFNDYNKMLWYGTGHFGGWNGLGGVTVGRVTDTRNETYYGKHYYNSIQSSWSGYGSTFVLIL